MRAALIALTIGGILVYSGLKGLTVLEVLAGEKGRTLDPKGGAFPNTSSRLVGTHPFAGSGVETLVTECNRMIAKDQPYKWGGGHSHFDPDGPWDCSGAVSWLTHNAGLLQSNTPLTSTGFMREGESGKGNEFTIYANPSHVFIQFETGSRAGQSWGTTRRFGRTGSLQWHNHTTAGFTARHYTGH